MAFKHIKNNEVPAQDLGALIVKNILNESGVPFSVARIELRGEQKEGLNLESDTAYYVLKGQGSFYIEGKEVKVQPGDVVYITKGTRYRDEGRLTVLAIAVPRFKPESHEYFC